MSRTSPSQRGFTLVEMLIALFIFGILASGAVMLLRFSVDAEAASRTRLDEIASLRRFTAIWNSDLAQAVARPPRGEDGERRLAFEGGAAFEDNVILRLTRSGWTNYEAAPRPSVQKVEYRLANGVLERRGYAQPDGAAPDAGTVVLEGVTGARLRFRQQDGNWTEQWNPPRAAEMPVAVELVVDRAEGDPLTVLALVGANYQ